MLEAAGQVTYIPKGEAGHERTLEQRKGNGYTVQ